MRILGKNYKNRRTIEAPLTSASTGGLRLHPETPTVTLAYYYNFVKFVSNAKGVLPLSKKNKTTTLNTAFAFSALLHLFFTS